MKKPILVTTLALTLTLGIAGVANAAINSNNPQPTQTTPCRSTTQSALCTSVMKNTPCTSAASAGQNSNNSPAASANPTGQATNQSLNLQATAQTPAAEQTAVTQTGRHYMSGQTSGTSMMSAAAGGNDTAASQTGRYHMSGQTNGTSMMSAAGTSNHSMTYNMPMHEQGIQQGTNVNPNQGAVSGNSNACSVSGRVMGRMGR